METPTMPNLKKKANIGAQDLSFITENRFSPKEDSKREIRELILPKK
jgi:hypothetical protein